MHIPTLSASEVTYELASQSFYAPNLPFIVNGLTDDWLARRKWIRRGKRRETEKEEDGGWEKLEEKEWKEKNGSARATVRYTGEERHANHVQNEGKTSAKESILDNNEKKPDWNYLEQQYGEFTVTVHKSYNPLNINERAEEDVQSSNSGQSSAIYGEAETVEMTFSDVVQMWRKGEGKGLYIKDWHLAREVRDSSKDRSTLENKSNHHEEDLTLGEDKSSPFFTVPEIFQDDWMDNYYTSHTKDDFTFVYFGTSGTFTPLHRDVYTSFSWSANILGRKMWYFVPPSSIPFIRQYPSNPRSAVIPDIRPGKVDVTRYPNFAKAKIISVLQEEGSIIFVPSGWYHCVENLGHKRSNSNSSATSARTRTCGRTADSPGQQNSENQALDFVISINRNWASGWNLHSMWESMKEEVKATEEALSDVREVLERGRRDRESQRGENADKRSRKVGHNAGHSMVTGESMSAQSVTAGSQEKDELQIDDHDDIEKEWNEIVQGVLEQNVGWGWNTFFAMIRHNLLYPAAPPSLSPPAAYLCGTLRDIFGLERNQTVKERGQESSIIAAADYPAALEAALQFIRDRDS